MKLKYTGSSHLLTTIGTTNSVTKWCGHPQLLSDCDLQLPDSFPSGFACQNQAVNIANGSPT